MSQSTHYVQQYPVESKAPPPNTVGWMAWAKDNLFAGPLNTLLTLVGAYFALLCLWTVIDFAFLRAVWTGSDRSACLGHVPVPAVLQWIYGSEAPVGACWAFIGAKFRQLIYGLYPEDQLWRVNTVYALALVLLIPLLVPRAPFKRLNAVLMLAVFPVVAYFLLLGGSFGLPYVETRSWGGLLVTLVVSAAGIVVSLPLGVILALGRRSELPIVRFAAITFIEFWRGVPLITILFFATYMLPLFLPEGMTFDNLLRVLVGVALFAAAYMAEVVRGGLQAVPKGQYEGAMALGLGYWRMMGLVILPQALKTVIPGIVNNFLGLFKDTTLVLVVSIFDLLGQLRASFTDPNWSTPVTIYTGFAFAGIIYWTFSYSMSRYARYLEHRLHRGHKR